MELKRILIIHHTFVREQAFLHLPMRGKLEMKVKKKELGLYIHIPFCVKKCDYCDFLSAPANEDTKEAYVDALIAEINAYRALAIDYQVKTIFIGGGTPSSIESKHIVSIIEAIKDVFKLKHSYSHDDIDINHENNIMKIAESNNIDKNITETNNIERNIIDSNYIETNTETNNIERTIFRDNSLNNNIEITIEINPGTITKEKLLDYKKAGINRLSFGLQSTKNQELKILGRIHTYEEFEQNYKLARDLGFQNINIDLMSALPGQTLEAWLENLNNVIKLNPEHISAYSLIIEEETPFYNRYSEEDQNEELDREIYKQTKECLDKAGYYRYEISNYAKLGYLCKHNTSYWTRDNYLGLGLGV